MSSYDCLRIPLVAMGYVLRIVSNPTRRGFFDVSTLMRYTATSNNHGNGEKVMFLEAWPFIRAFKHGTTQMFDLVNARQRLNIMSTPRIQMHDVEQGYLHVMRC